MGKRRGVGRRHMITSGDEPARRRPLAVWGRSVAASVLLVAVLPTACGDTKDASVCTAFAEWVEARAEINGIDPTSRSTADEIEAVERYLASVHRLRQAGGKAKRHCETPQGKLCLGNGRPSVPGREEADKLRAV